MEKNSVRGWFYRLSLPLLLVFNFLWLFMPGRGESILIPSYDSVYFLKIAYNILNFGELGWQAYFEPFFYSFVIALFSFFTDELLYSGILVSKVSKLFLVLVVFFLAKEIYDKRVAIISAVLVTFMPHIVAISGTSQSEGLYTFLITMSIYIMWMAHKRTSLSLSVLAGLSFTIAYLTRSEGIFILFFLATFLFFAEIKKKGLNKKPILVLLLTVSVFIVSALPYFIFLKNHYGTWTIGTKTASVYFWVREKAFHDPDPDRSEYSLSPEGELNLISLKSKELINYWLKDPEKSVKVYLRNLKEEIPGFIPNDSGSWHFPQVYPVYFVVPLLLGLLIRRRKKTSMEADFYLLSVFPILFIYPLLTGGWWRYLVNYSPVLMILAASGVVEINGYLKEKNILEKTTGKGLLIWLFVMTVSVYHYGVMATGKPPEDKAQHNSRKRLLALETNKAGEWAQKHFPPGSNYMVQWSRLPYYLNGRWTAMPSADYYGMVWYAKKNSVDYLVFETSGRGESEELARIMGNTPDLEVAEVYESQANPYGVVFLKLKR